MKAKLLTSKAEVLRNLGRLVLPLSSCSTWDTFIDYLRKEKKLCIQ